MDSSEFPFDMPVLTVWREDGLLMMTSIGQTKIIRIFHLNLTMNSSEYPFDLWEENDQ